MSEPPENLREIASTHFQETLTLMQNGHPKEALESLQKAEEAAQKAKANDILIHTLNVRGQLMLNLGALDEAVQICGQTSKIFAELSTKGPENDFFQQCLQMNLNNIETAGNMFSNMGRFPQAKNAYETGLSISQKMLDLLHQDTFCINYTATVLNSLGVLFIRDMGCPEEANIRFEKALEIYESLLKNDPENVGYQSDVAMTLNNLGTLLSDIGRLEDAKGRYEKALEIYESLLKNDPENVGYQSYVGTTLNNLGNLLFDMGYIEEAKKRYERALEIYTEPMQYLTIGRKSESIIRLIGLNSEKAEKETNSFNQMKCLKEAFQLCKEHREFFIKYEQKHERKLVMEAGLSAYIDFLMKNVSLEGNFEKRVKEYEKALQAVEKLGEVEDDETVSKLCSSAACYLRGRKLVNEALASRQPELELLRQAVDQFKIAKETYDKANVCFCVYIGLLKILDGVKELEEVDVPKLKELVQKVVESLPEDVNPSIRVSFENIPQIFEENDKMTRKELLKELDEKVSAIEYKALENFFGHVHEKIKDYFDEPFSPNLIYENWKLKILFDDPGKVKGKLTIKAGNKILLNRTLTPEEVKNNLLEIDYLKLGYIPQGEDEITFTTPGQKKPVMRPIDYFESVGRDNKTRIFGCDCCNGVCVEQDLKIAAVQLKYHVYGENSVVKLTVDDAYHRKVMAVLNAVKNEADIVVFPEFSIPFDYLGDIQEYADENGIIVVAGSHYVTDGKLGDYGKLFCREFEEGDLRKNVSPVVIPSSRIVHNEKLLGAREERELYFNKGMKAGKVNHIFRLRDNLNVGVVICYEYLNSDLRQRLIPACDVILVPQTNPKPERFYETAKSDLDNPMCAGNRAFVMANGAFTVEDSKILGGSMGIVSTLDRHTYTEQNKGIISPIGKVIEQFILIASINKDFNAAMDTQAGQIPIKTQLIHIFEEKEILSSSEEEGKRFMELLETIENCGNRAELKKILNGEDNGATIKAFSPLMHEHVQNLNELALEEMKKKCCSILIQEQQT
ncbi:MAG: tetratricopeptide repeat protein [Methanosarcinaceae archaeon]|nr:tetratricopeptide repeat protein [Methanosarcinaceae archaeon]